MVRARKVVRTYRHGGKAVARGRGGFAGWLGTWFPWVAPTGPAGLTRRARRMKARRRRWS